MIPTVECGTKSMIARAHRTRYAFAGAHRTDKVFTRTNLIREASSAWFMDTTCNPEPSTVVLALRTMLGMILGAGCMPH